MPLATATDLNSWADKLDARSQLPDLVRRLVVSTASTVSAISFRAGEGIQFPGWDGLVEAKESTPFVSSGKSFWEMGVSANVKEKAEEDYNKRTDNPLGQIPAECTFVFVTPRRWSGKSDWVNERNTDGIWKQVVAFDADDLEIWLRTCPSVHSWVSQLLELSVLEALALEDWWITWINESTPAFSPDLVLAGRDQEALNVIEFLDSENSSISLMADSTEEALAFIAATIVQASERGERTDLLRSVVVTETKGWEAVDSATVKQVILALCPPPSSVLRESEFRKIIWPLGKGQHSTGTRISLSRARRSNLKSGFTDIGLSDEQADSLADVGRRNFKALRRRISNIPQINSPEWADPRHANHIASMLLAGNWVDRSDGDRSAIENISGMSYSDFVKICTRWSAASDPPIRLVDGKWLITSKEDAWTLTSRFMTSDELSRFEDTALLVLRELDPSLELAPDNRWMASVEGKSHKYSAELREGIADSLAMIAAISEDTEHAAGHDPKSTVRKVNYQLFDGIADESDGALWKSLSGVLPLIAEASPETFLRAADKSLQGDNPPLMKMFEDASSPSGMFEPTYHTGLLWAFETLAWNAKFMPQAAVILARLCELDPDGKLANRPFASLSRIFDPFSPNTTVDSEGRFQVLDNLYQNSPTVSWDLQIGLIPTHTWIGMPSHSSRWHSWKPEGRPVIKTNGSVRTQCRGQNSIPPCENKEIYLCRARTAYQRQLPRENIEPHLGIKRSPVVTVEDVSMNDLAHRSTTSSFQQTSSYSLYSGV